MSVAPVPRLPIRTRADGSAFRSALGCGLEIAGNGLLAASTAAAIVAAILIAVEWSIGDHVMPATALFLWAGRGICVAAPLMAIGRFLRREAAVLGDFVLVLDQDGASWSGGAAGALRWSELSHVIVTAKPRNGRRLIFVRDQPQQAGSADGIVRASLVSHLARRLVSPSRYLLDLPIDRFEPSAEAVVRTVRSASGGRFPDRYPIEQFPQLDERH